jgi:sec-independent protein translocase protein TatA
MFGNLGFWEITILALVILLVFGAKRLPEIGQSLGKGIREFKRSLKEIGTEVERADAPEKIAPPRRAQVAPSPPADQPPAENDEQS